MTSTTYTALPTNNKGWGFYGTLITAGRNLDPVAFWTTMSATIYQLSDGDCSGFLAEGIRDFLDSRDGRHLADEVVNQLHDAPNATVQQLCQRAADRFQAWKINRATEREYGIPAGLPYLEGWVRHYELAAEAEAA